MAQEETGPVEGACLYSEHPPEAVNFDRPESQLERVPRLLIPEDAVVGEVRVLVQPIFNTWDPDQDGVFHRTVNFLNIPTRKGAIRAQLVFEPGEPYEARRLEESERALRGRDYLVDAWVRPYRVCGNRVDVAVVTRDTWTLLPTLGFSRSGGENSTQVGLSDENFLGTGKGLSFSRTSDQARTEVGLRYQDPNLFSTHWQGGLAYTDSSDGRERAASLERPFYRQGAPWALALSVRDNQREDELFVGGNAINRFARDLEEATVRGGLNLATTTHSDRRLLAGYRYRRDRFDTVPGETPPSPLPEDRTLSFPFLGFEYEQNRFHETVNLTQIQRVEDVRDGILFRTEIGYSSPDFGASDEQLILENRYSDSLLSTDTRFADYELRQEGRYDLEENRFESLLGHLSARYFHGGDNRATSWFVQMRLSAARNLTRDEQLTLGGDNGLRGYPLRYQVGDRSALVTLEKRYFSDIHPWRLFRLGGVAFVDAGRAWFSDGRKVAPAEGKPAPDRGLLRNVGVGLRVASSRFEVNRMLHLDMAFPLDGDESIDSVQFLVRGRTSF
ncbi:MAG: BamA/TamA family outer membrane protein [Oleiphilaceae bacterium]|nr:BamA/TamA family outer membrane protein [Oleiphilaceae bacterium]